MSARIAIYKNPLNPHDCARHDCPAGVRLIDWLFANHPAGFGRPVEILLNGEPLPIAGADRVLAAGDDVAILVGPGAAMPAGKIIGTLIVKALISAAIAAVVSIAFSLIFKPRRPHSQETPAPDPIYTIAAAQNAARVGEPVPVLYGEMTTVPDFASQPYAFFEDNNQYLDQLLVIGQGEYELTEVYVGETPISSLQPGNVETWLFGPGDHGQVMGTIEAATGIMENVVSSPEVADQEFTAASSWVGDVGPFVTCKPGRRGNQIMWDFVFPQGLYEIDDGDGSLDPLTIEFNLDYQEINDAGSPSGTWTSHAISFSLNTNTPVRRSYAVTVPEGRYQAMVSRVTPAPVNARQISAFIWTGLRFRLIDSVAPVYGPVTLLAVRIRATNGIAGNASSRIRARVVRKLPRLGEGPALASASPADAFVDVYCNPVYGAKRPLEEVDLAELTRIEDSWLGMAQFNGGFAQRSTIWEALNIVLQTANAAPLPLGQLMSVAQEGVKANRRQLFSDANMIRESLAIGYTFDKPGDYDGVRVEYRDPLTWNALYATWPVGALDCDQVQLFGCSDGVQAGQFAKLLWNKRLRLRKTASFETELEGLLARMGDRIAVSADLPRWGMSGVVIGAAGETLWLDKVPNWGGTGHKLILRDERGTPSVLLDVTPGAEPNQVILAAPAPFPLFGTGYQEPTHYAFGESVKLVRDFTVQNIEHRDSARVSVEALAYDPEVFTDTLPWLLEPT